MFKEKRLYLEDPKEIHKRRKFAKPSGPSMTSTRHRDRASTTTKKINSFLAVPNGLSLDSLEEALKPLIDELDVYEKVQLGKSYVSKNVPLNDMMEAMRSVGARILISWSIEEIAKSGWKTGDEMLTTGGILKANS